MDDFQRMALEEYTGMAILQHKHFVSLSETSDPKIILLPRLT